jgi:hypothetical protein
MRSLPLILRRALLSATALVAMASVANATVNNYGNLVGPNIMYLNVVETATQFPGPMPPTLLGAPQLAGDNLEFNPLAFAGSAQNGDFLVQDAQLSIDQIMTNSPLGAISKLTINEGGGYIVVGAPGAGIARASLITSPILVAQINGVGPAPVNVTILPTLAFSNVSNGAVTVTQTANSIQFASNGGVGNGSWGITATYDITAAIIAAGLPANTRVTKLGTLALDNQLVRDTDPSSFAYIDKKFFNITVTAIPEPSTILMGLMGGVGLLVGGRRLRKAKTA